MFRPYDDRMAFKNDSTIATQSDYGPNMVVVIPFKGEVRIKSINIIGGPDGSAPLKLKLYKNENSVDFSIIEDKKPLHVV